MRDEMDCYRCFTKTPATAKCPYCARPLCARCLGLGDCGRNACIQRSRPPEAKPSEREIVELLKAIEKGDVTLAFDGDSWDEVYAGNVAYLASNGWKIVVFNDCDDWDYIDSVTAPDGRFADFADFCTPYDEGDPPGMPEVYGYAPPEDVYLRCYVRRAESATQQR